MTRHGFLAWLFGGATAGQTPHMDTIAVRPEPAWKTGPALNGQCPVCGAMAEVWKVEFMTVYDRYEPIPGDSMAMRGVGPRRVPRYLYPEVRHVICQKCSNVFGQRAEEEKP